MRDGSPRIGRSLKTSFTLLSAASTDFTVVWARLQ